MLDPRTALALALACSTLACQDQDAEALDRAIDDFAERFKTSRDLLCACPEQLGFATADECEAASGEIDGAARGARGTGSSTSSAWSSCRMRTRSASTVWAGVRRTGT